MNNYAKELQKELQSSNKLPIFEIKTTELETGKTEYITFDISIKDNEIVAEHMGLTVAENESEYVAYKSFDIDENFTLDEHLQELHEICMNAVIDSELYRLN